MWSRGDEDPLATEMRLFCACERWAFNRLLEGASRDGIKKRGQEVFGLNSRYADDARLRAQGILDARTSLLGIEIPNTEEKLRRARTKLRHTERRLAHCADPVKAGRLRRAASRQRARAGSLEKKLADLRTHQERGTFPPVVFGGRKLWRRVCKGRATVEEWQAARKNKLFSRGNETKGGNPNLKLSFRNEEFRLSAVISHLSEESGTDALGRPKMTRARKWKAASGCPRNTGTSCASGWRPDSRTRWSWSAGWRGDSLCVSRCAWGTSPCRTCRGVRLGWT